VACASFTHMDAWIASIENAVVFRSLAKLIGHTRDISAQNWPASHDTLPEKKRRPSTHSHRDIATDVKKKFRRGNVALVSTSCMDAWRDVIKTSSRAVVRYHWITL